MTDTSESKFNFATLTGWAEYYHTFRNNIFYGNVVKEYKGLYCPSCGDSRRVRFEHLHFPTEQRSLSNKVNLLAEALENTQTVEEVIEKLGIIVAREPIVIRLYCVECRTQFTALIYGAAEGKAGYFIAPNVFSGLATPHTDSGVNYYLDQAYKAQSIGANSAAVAMYRGALEHLLFSQGYTNGMLGQKLEKLKHDIANKEAPDWAYSLETDYLNIITELGNGAIHPNGGDIELQKELDDDLLNVLDVTFSGLLYHIYELPYIQESILKNLQAKAGLFKQRKQKRESS
ncbi:MAG: DUF4145 domain-containing protein [Anaerolineae bacterium]|nr:DUF4145 domain-containing protein [Anaerolineae bacterium]